jgi:predicted HTH transcriptional regulator
MADNETAKTAKAEDYLKERKTKNDLKDLLKTMVAFANSVRPGHIATILIGERNDGTPEGLTDETVDSIQKPFGRKLRRSIHRLSGSRWRMTVPESSASV